MRFARIKFLSLLFSVFVASAMTTTTAVSGAATVGHVFSAIDTAATLPSYSQAANRNGYVVLQAWQTERLHALKAANPAVKVLVYENLGFSSQASGSNGLSPSGVAYSEAPESWFLKNTHGERFTSWNYEWLWAMDVGNPAYQKQWAENVISKLNSEGWDGVMLDDASATMKYQYNPSEVAKYPDDASYSAAMESALAYIGPRIHADGKLAIPNFGSWVEYPETYDRWLQYTDGALDEMFVKWGRGSGEGYRDEAQWNTQIAEAKYAASKGKAFLAYTQGSAGETQAARYGYASMILASEGDGFYSFTPDYSSETWFPEYEYDLGNPVGPEQREASGVHRRTFERGLVLVNPTGSSHAVEFGGTYSGSGLTAATKTTMQPHTGLVLTGSPSANAKTEEVAPIGVTVTASPTPSSGQPEVQLQWSKGKSKVRSYRVVRNSTSGVRTNLRHRVERRVAKGHVYRYRILGLDSHHEIVAESKLVRIRPGSRFTKVVQRPRRSA